MNKITLDTKHRLLKAVTPLYLTIYKNFGIDESEPLHWLCKAHQAEEQGRYSLAYDHLAYYKVRLDFKKRHPKDYRTVYQALRYSYEN